MGVRLEFDLGLLLQIGTSLVLAGAAYAATTTRIDALEGAVASLERRLERERDERLTSDRNAVADRALWWARVARQRQELVTSTSGAGHR